MKQIFDRNYPVTSLLLGLTTVVFLLTQLVYFGQATSAQTIFNVGGMLGAYVKYDPTQLWRLVSPIFVHIGWQHFLLNMLSLYFMGRMVEDIFGSKNYLLLYVLSGVMGNVFTLFLTPNVVAAGASTSLFGLFAAVAFLGYQSKNHYLNQIGRSYFTLIVINMVFSLFSPDTSLAGHLGGAVGGLLLSVILKTQVDPFAFKKEQRVTASLVFIGLSLGMIGLSLWG